MPRQVALTICLAFVFYLFWVERRASLRLAWGRWIPLTWMFFASSRFLSHWLRAFGLDIGGTDADGSPLDRLLFIALIGAAILVLRKRKVDWARIVFQNKWVWLFFVFGAVSVVWSAFPAISLKRLIKAVGNVMMALVILTDERPHDALGGVLRRLAYLTLPLSVVFCKYFPELGRQYHSTGTQMFTGVGMQKNTLGELCLIAALGAVWSLLYKPSARTPVIGEYIRVEWVILALVAYLLSLANSATSLTCLTVGSCVLVAGRLPVASTPRKAAISFVLVGAFVAVLDSNFDLSAQVIEFLGRRPDLTTRVPMWTEMLQTVEASPLLGAGFEIYPLTDVGARILGQYNVPNTHNGYLETYLSSGLIGLMILIGGMISALVTIARRPRASQADAILRLGLLVAVALYNWTESAFRSVSSLWVLFFIANLDVGVVAATVARASLTIPDLRRRARSRARVAFGIEAGRGSFGLYAWAPRLGGQYRHSAARGRSHWAEKGSL